jgi:hypothetical protein
VGPSLTGSAGSAPPLLPDRAGEMSGRSRTGWRSTIRSCALRPRSMPCRTRTTACAGSNPTPPNGRMASRRRSAGCSRATAIDAPRRALRSRPGDRPAAALPRAVPAPRIQVMAALRRDSDSRMSRGRSPRSFWNLPRRNSSRSSAPECNWAVALRYRGGGYALYRETRVAVWRPSAYARPCGGRGDARCRQADRQGDHR